MLEYPLKTYCDDDYRENLFKSMKNMTLKEAVEIMGKGYFKGLGGGRVEVKK